MNRVVLSLGKNKPAKNGGMRQTRTVTMKRRHSKPARFWLFAATAIWMLVILPFSAMAAPYAAMVIDARTGKTLHSENADTRLHPASLTKMMTLYVVFEAVENGEISLDTMVRISRKAASEPPSKIGLRQGQRIKLRYLIRAAAIKSANDAATALGEAIEGSEAAFARRMNRTAKAMGMTRTTFKNAHGLTETGHLSTARDMTTLGRHLFYDFPDYYHLFSRLEHNAKIRTVRNTNRRFLNDYKGADGIKTGYTRAAGFNLVASAKRGRERIITTVFGGRSTTTRNAQVAKLMSLGFKKAPTHVAEVKPSKPDYSRLAQSGTFGKRSTFKTAVNKSLRPKARPTKTGPTGQVASLNLKDDIAAALIVANRPELSTISGSSLVPKARPAKFSSQAAAPSASPAEPEIVARLSTSGGQNWAINVGRFSTQFSAEKMLLKTALAEMSTLNGSLRKVQKGKLGFEATFVGLSQDTADRACKRLAARNVTCTVIGPS